MAIQAPITTVAVESFVIPTDYPEADGTLNWGRTTLVVATVTAGGIEGLGYGYADRAAAQFATSALAPRLIGLDAFAVNRAWTTMTGAIRNLGRSGMAMMAVAALDAALWDLKGKLLGLSLADLLGRARDGTPAYGSGGFITYDDARLRGQLAGWVEAGFAAVKIKVGDDRDRERVRAARQAIGPDVELFVDANGAYDRKTALARAHLFAKEGVTWFEEPVSSDDLDGLRLIRDRAPPGMRIAAGEYDYTLFDALGLLEAGAVDVVQADATRCGVTGFLAAAALAEAFNVPLSAHTAPSLHAQVGCACRPLVNIEFFHDHARIETMLFEGAALPIAGKLTPAADRPGLGLSFRRVDAERYRA
jgi:L-alanine-DL-glutamate epimerase-like enolase superfamily enzyme